MLFNSITFAIFFAVVYTAYWLLHKKFRMQNLLLLGASYFFYGWWDVRFLFLIVLSTYVDFGCALAIEKGRLSVRQKAGSGLLLLLCSIFFVTVDYSAVSVGLFGEGGPISVEWGKVLPGDFGGYLFFAGTGLLLGLFNVLLLAMRGVSEEFRRKFFVSVSVVVNLVILGIFKYFNFFIESAVDVYGLVFNARPDVSLLNIVLPVGISFYTFQTMSYTIDVYRGKISASGSLLDIATYVAFFPQLVAGPIERGAHLLPQFQGERKVGLKEFREGMWLIFWGLYKKIVVADNMAIIVNQVFGPYDNLADAVGGVSVPGDGLRLLFGVYAFAFQIYGDFSGYSDIARGTARLLGFDIMLNFRNPYAAISPSDFWRRWHISLSTWLRDYLYIPLGGNRGSRILTYRNLMLTMVLGGLWHGAAWTFVLWGVFHGFILAVYRFLGIGFDRKQYRPLKRFLMWILMFHLVCFGWLLFRAQNLTTVGVFLESIFTKFAWSQSAGDVFGRLVFYGWFLVLWQVIQHFSNRLDLLEDRGWFVRLNVWIFVIMSILALGAQGGQEFIYFAF